MYYSFQTKLLDLKQLNYKIMKFFIFKFFFFIFLAIISSSCEKVENCNCGEIISSDIDVNTSTNEFAINVTNYCTNNTKTFIVDFETFRYAEEENDGRFCTASW